MSTKSKASAKSIAIKKKLRRRLGLVQKRLLQLPQNTIKEGEGVEWSVADSACPPLPSYCDSGKGPVSVDIELAKPQGRKAKSEERINSSKAITARGPEETSPETFGALIEHLKNCSSRATEYYVFTAESGNCKDYSAVRNRIRHLFEFHECISCYCGMRVGEVLTLKLPEEEML